MSAWAVIVAAGRGERAGMGRNKVFCEIDGRSVLGRCLDAFQRSELFEGAVVVISRTDEALYETLVRREGPFPLVKAVAPGGASRRESVYSGLRALPDGVCPPDI